MEPRIRILFVDDEDWNLRRLKVIFRDRYEVASAASGAEALEWLATEPADIVVAAERMPDMPGHDLLDQIRDLLPLTVRVLMAGYADMVGVIGSVAEGMVYRFLNTPWKQDEVRAVVDQSADFALSIRRAFAESGPPLFGTIRSVHAATSGPPLAVAAALLKIPGLAADHHEPIELFTRDHDVVGAASADEARGILRQRDVGMVVSGSRSNGYETAQLLSMLEADYPSIAVVFVSEPADGRIPIRLMAEAETYQFAMKPIKPNLFRLALSAALREHDRHCADRHARHVSPGMAPESASDLADSVIVSLSRFSTIW